jgi:hypothetical protein
MGLWNITYDVLRSDFPSRVARIRPHNIQTFWYTPEAENESHPESESPFGYASINYDGCKSISQFGDLQLVKWGARSRPHAAIPDYFPFDLFDLFEGDMNPRPHNWFSLGDNQWHNCKPSGIIILHSILSYRRFVKWQFCDYDLNKLCGTVTRDGMEGRWIISTRKGFGRYLITLISQRHYIEGGAPEAEGGRETKSTRPTRNEMMNRTR